MPKTERLIELMMTVHTKRKFTAGELAAEFGVSYRTILRDLDELSALGVPIYSETGANGGYYLLNEPVLPPLFFTQSEAAAMFFAYQSLQFFGSLPFDAETRMVLKKFYRHLPVETQERIDAMKDRIVFWNPHRPKAAEHLETLLDAAINQSVLTSFMTEQTIARRDPSSPSACSAGTASGTVRPIALKGRRSDCSAPTASFGRKKRPARWPASFPIHRFSAGSNIRRASALNRCGCKRN
ncbi:hypothetical protein RSC2_04116 [Bacillus paralicheniformis]|uniref:HTH deoR-type domain-containing protein n=1 Tax=Bacillus paralicheniformis TaxID=1648923 RepID=A0A7Z0X0Y0_9BACI|nr:hypothetical protein B4121_0674 [Bacillus paralicheniformis]BCE06093.1 hypothetical protein RSC1_02250 [Bacillus paralicheniformis]BCE12320.1 hypothetical protein RSC2_04116 [Bacillus paralicheniformis]BCE13945.1 hypothetical protein RSC3_01301 [Bacillus paralicheniformis]